MKDLVEEGTSILNGDRDIRGFGELLHECWQSKRSMSSQVSNLDVDAMYERAISAGAIGGKITGAGAADSCFCSLSPTDKSKFASR